MNSSDPWSSASTVRGFATGAPNDALIAFARAQPVRGRALDIGCGAGRNALPLAGLGWDVLGIDRSLPMLIAAAERGRGEQVASRCDLALASMDRLPVASQSCQLIVAHGIWNLAHTTDEFRRGLRDAARVAVPGAALFVFTFSRSTLPVQAEPIPGESFAFTSVSAEPNIYLTREQLIAELAATGFAEDALLPLDELNPRRPGMLAAAGSPVIWQGGFRLVSAR